MLPSESRISGAEFSFLSVERGPLSRRACFPPPLFYFHRPFFFIEPWEIHFFFPFGSFFLGNDIDDSSVRGGISEVKLSGCFFFSFRLEFPSVGSARHDVLFLPTFSPTFLLLRRSYGPYFQRIPPFLSESWFSQPPHLLFVDRPIGFPLFKSISFCSPVRLKAGGF